MYMNTSQWAMAKANGYIWGLSNPRYLVSNLKILSRFVVIIHTYIHFVFLIGSISSIHQVF